MKPMITVKKDDLDRVSIDSLRHMHQYFGHFNFKRFGLVPLNHVSGKQSNIVPPEELSKKNNGGIDVVFGTIKSYYFIPEDIFRNYLILRLTQRVDEVYV